jgi:hypothetical protein
MLTCLLALAAGARTVASAQRPTLDDLLTGLDTYLHDYEERMSTLVAEERYELIVTYQREAALDMFVPDEMEEVYAYGQLVTHARARYTNFRQFGTTARLVSPE